MEIKDYLHLHLGCQVAVIDTTAAEYGCEEVVYTCKLNGVTQSEVEPERMIAIVDDSFYEVYIEKVKPILFPLSSMKEEDGRFVLENYSFDGVVMPMDERQFAIEIAKRLSKQTEVVKYLLSKHYDLFGLIDAGLAISAIKL